MPTYSISNATLSINGEIVGAVVCDETQGVERTDCSLFRPVTIHLRAVRHYVPDTFVELVKDSGRGPRNRWGALK